MPKTSWKLSLRQYCDKLHFIVFAQVFLAIALIVKPFIIVYIIYIYFLFNRKLINKKLIIFLILLALIFIFLFLFYNISPNYINGNIYVIEVKENYFIYYYKFNKYMSYTKLNIEAGDILYITAYKAEYLSPSYPGDFDTLNFLRGKEIKNIYEIEEYQIISHIFNFNNLRNKILTYYKPKIASEYYDIFSCLIFGQNSIEDTSSYAKLNILHVLALSGFHLLLIYNFLFKIIFKISKRYILSENISLLFITFYVLLCGMSLSLLRALFFLILTKINKRMDIGFNKLDIFSITFLLLTINPLKIYNIGFILANLASFLILFLKDFVKCQNKFKRQILEGILFLLICFPFISNMSNQLSLFSFISFIFANIISYIFIPILFIFLIMPSLSHYLVFLILGFTSELEFISNLLVISFPYMNNYYKLIYYFLLFLILFNLSQGVRKKTYIFSFIILLLIYLISPKLTKDKVVFIDCGQGDAVIVNSRNKYFLIDCYNAYDYLLKTNITKLEALFISHSDSDHLGDALEIVANLDVNIVYYSKYDKEIINIFKGYDVRLEPLDFNDNVKIGNSLIHVISGLKEYEDINDNSLVFYLEIMNKTFLFTGDISKEVELDLLPYLNDVDVLKVAHHGSDTSTSREFLTCVKPEIAIISVGYQNRYGFPKKITVNNLADYSLIYLTYNYGNITINANTIKTYKNEAFVL